MDDPKSEGPDNLAGYEYVRRLGKQANKFELDMRAVGIRYAIQHHRAIRRLHTFHPGERAELDYTKYAVWAYPHGRSEEPSLFYTGIGVDHTSGVIKGYVIATQPSAATAIRLYKRCVLPKRLWLPAHLQRYADEWDVVGLDRIVALDNAMDFRGNSVAIMFITFGIIVLLMPPRRGDMKGLVERTQLSVETHNISMLSGYVPNRYKFTDPRQRRVIDRAQLQANLTVAEYEEAFTLAVLEHNHAKHPRFKKPRIAVYRNGIESAPPVLPTGKLQINSAFALTHKNRKVTREGVEVDGYKYNSDELNELYRVRDVRVDVKINPDDVRTALIHHQELPEPIEAELTTHVFPGPTTLELAKGGMRREEGDDDGDLDVGQSASDRYLAKLHELQTRGRRGRPRRANADIQAAVHAAALPPVAPPAPRTIRDAEFDSLFDGDDDAAE